LANDPFHVAGFAAEKKAIHSFKDDIQLEGCGRQVTSLWQFATAVAIGMQSGSVEKISLCDALRSCTLSRERVAKHDNIDLTPFTVPLYSKMKALHVITACLVPLLMAVLYFSRQTTTTPFQASAARASERESRWFPE